MSEAHPMTELELIEYLNGIVKERNLQPPLTILYTAEDQWKVHAGGNCFQHQPTMEKGLRALAQRLTVEP